MYVRVFEKLYKLDGIFLEGYFNNLKYILSYLDKIGVEKNAFYIEYLASYEKVLIFYYLTSYNTSEEFKSIVKKYGIINDLVNHPSYFTDSPSVDEFRKELEVF